MQIPAYISDQLWRRRSAGSGLPLDGDSEPSPLTHCRLTGLLSGAAARSTQAFSDCSQTAWGLGLERRQTRNNKYIRATFHYAAEKAAESPLPPGNCIKADISKIQK